MAKICFFWSLTFFTVIMWAIFNVLIPFYPNKAKKFNLSYTIIGFVIGIFSIGNYFSSLWIGKYMHLFDKKKLILSNLFIYALFTFIFGLLHFIKNKILFIIVSIVTRLIQGFAVGILYTVFISFARKLFGDEYEKRIALLEAASGLGITIGPVLGSFLISFLSFFSVYIVLTALILFYAIFYYIQQKQIAFQPDEINHEDKQLSFFELFKNRCFLLTYIYLTFAIGPFCAINSKISLSLQERFHLSKSEVGYIIFIGPLFFFLSSLCYYKYNPPLNSKLKLIIGNFSMLLGLFLIVPHTKVHIPDKLYNVAISYVFIGGAGAFTFIPIYTEFAIILSKMNLQVSDHQIDSMAAALYVSLDGIGEFIGPILGKILLKYIVRRYLL